MEASRGAANGAGLGLPMVRQIAALHGGTVTVDSREGEGSCFTPAVPTRTAGGKIIFKKTYCLNVLLINRWYAGYNKRKEE